MECNKDEATRAKEIAEKKFSAKDIVGAKKFALKAQNLYPGLKGIPQMIATLDVYVAAENKINGEADWYGILGADPRADDDAVRKHYRKLALMLHPDKNKSIGADGAFKFISEAWSLLSDKNKRMAYDQRRNGKVFQKRSFYFGSSSAKPGSNGFFNFTKSSVKTHKSTSRTGHSSTPASSYKTKPNTFWTVCHGCKMQYEYLRVYLNHKLLCPNCHEPFIAVEMPPPPLHVSRPAAPSSSFKQQQNSNHQAATSRNTSHYGRSNAASSNLGAGGSSGPDSYNQGNFQWGAFSRAGGATTAARAASVVQKAYEKVKREREEAQAATKREEALKRKNHAASKKMSSASSNVHSKAAKRRRGVEDVGHGNNGIPFTTGFRGAGTANISGFKQGSSENRVNGITKPYGMRDVSQFETQTVLMEKAKTDIRKNINEWKSATLVKSGPGEGVENEKAIDQGKNCVSNPDDTTDQNKCGEPEEMENGFNGIEISPITFGMKTDSETLEMMSINVPDPDFHDFDRDRTERCFGENQVWAAYDDDDGMPRYYAMIHGVISLNPFKMRISWLNSKTNRELGLLNWVGSGFSKTCGDFRVGRYEIYNSLNSFSHKVRWIKGTRGVIRVYPRKGDVWALYRNWSPEWNELTADEVIHKYDMVEVLEDYSEDLGVTVTPLVKVAGFKTVFHQHLDPKELRRIPREEMFRFSHHVPSYLLMGQEGPNAPKGCRELDPAATPSELLQVVVDVKEAEIVENGGNKMESEENNEGKSQSPVTS
ncbi:hypothetical protein OIU79_009907 [Salix purpurea]|uniref:J domain-containing protein n=1 Tax=Salix purpurea TaxID=77065 RepID=A0A9Q0QEX5_SALPP|nr:hypothetical protein OIU79_009907 [Salix purpurea]KAJ6705097.1 hypothetical protein OIU79_009907 [Salix purpurea]KAJ6705098.1 hypothetical protein OIU79_009907 [Salix purpurea]KAJ6705099.1 hypothetical protein OIU79_009907 [Salix purpurea]KAJ6705100.1 hypothetical protein OIU79_009907 [Salix purpurea]